MKLRRLNLNSVVVKMDEETKKRLPKELNRLEPLDSLIREPTGLTDSFAEVGIGMLDIYKVMGKERYSLPKFEDIEKYIYTLKSQENVDQDLIEQLEEMKKAAELQKISDINPMEEIRGFKGIQDIVRDEQNTLVNGLRQSLDDGSLEIIKNKIEKDPGIFKSKYPEFILRSIGSDKLSKFLLYSLFVFLTFLCIIPIPR